MKSNVVFVGPSLDPDSVRQNLDCTVLGPIRRGDIDALLAASTKANSIGIVDGQFFQSMSISPKEVLRAIDSNIRVFGAASMGALRAVELAVYGMVGVGLIFDLFASGELDADDEVAMTFDPATFRATSEPMVNIRIALQRASSEGHLSIDIAERAIRAAKQMYYPQRSYRALLQAVRPELDDDEFDCLEKACRHPFDAKQSDAIEMLTVMRASHG